MGKGGQPTKYNKKFHPDDFIRLSKLGKCKTQICAVWDISRETIYNWAEKHKEFFDAIKKGEDFCAAWYMDSGQDAIHSDPKTFNTGAFVWMTKNILKWSDKIQTQVQHSGDILSGEELEAGMKELVEDDEAAELTLKYTEDLERIRKKKMERKNGQD